MGNNGVRFMANMNEFLLQYYMQRRFNTMPPEVRAQFDVYLASDDFRGNMKDWKSKLMHQDANGKWVENDLPDPNDATGNFFLDDKEWAKFFNAFQDAFREMSASKDSFKDNAKATSFLNEYFGDPATHLFANAVANPTAESLINGDFKQFLTDHRNGLEIYLKQWGLVDSDFSYSDLLNGISSKKYNTAPDFQKKLKTVAQYITFYVQQPDFQQALGLRGRQLPNFTDIENGFDTSTVNPNKLDYFKRNYKSLLNTLVTDSKVYDVFKLYDHGKISKHLEASVGKVDYANADSKDYVPPKRSDELTPWQHLKDNVKDTWTDYMDKYIKLRGDRLYFSNSAQLIFKALTGAKFKPTDGLDKLLSSAGDIKKNLMYKSPRAVDHFDWMNKTLGELKNTMPKAFAGALKTGRQMKAIVSELVIKAVRENKMDEAKTAMEVLSVVKYGYTTSKIMDALGNEKLSIFSDGGLSWNKNQAVQFVTNAMDKSIKAAFMGVGYLITMGGNAIRLNGSKFNGKTGRIKGARDTWIADNNAQRAAAIAHRDTENPIDEAARTPFEGTLHTLNTAGFNATTINAKKVDRTNAKTDAENKKNTYDTAQQAYDNNQYIIDNDINLANQRTNLLNEIATLRTDITALENLLNNPATFASLPPATASALASQLMQKKTSKETELQAKDQQRIQIDAERAANAAAVNNARRAEPGLRTARDNAQRDYNAAQTIFDDLDAKINDYENATENLKELNDRIQKRNDTVNNWDDNHKDKYRELMAYWDMLETGRDSHTGKMYSWTPGSAKDKQKNFNKKNPNTNLSIADQIILDNLNNYQITA